MALDKTIEIHLDNDDTAHHSLQHETQVDHRRSWRFYSHIVVHPKGLQSGKIIRDPLLDSDHLFEGKSSDELVCPQRSLTLCQPTLVPGNPRVKSMTQSLRWW